MKTGHANIEVIRVVGEDGKEMKTPFNEIDEELIPEDEYVEVVDMEFDSSLVTSSEYAKYLAFKKKLEKEEEEERGSVSFALPRKVSWGVIGVVGTVMVQLLIGTVIIYNSQQNFNDRVMDRLDDLEHSVKKLSENTYSKKEEDLKYENLRAETNKNKELLQILRDDIRRGK